MGYQEIEEEHPELRGFETFSAAWHRARRAAHLAKYPNSDRATRLNLDSFVQEAEAREKEETP